MCMGCFENLGSMTHPMIQMDLRMRLKNPSSEQIAQKIHIFATELQRLATHPYCMDAQAKIRRYCNLPREHPHSGDAANQQYQNECKLLTYA